MGNKSPKLSGPLFASSVYQKNKKTRHVQYLREPALTGGKKVFAHVKKYIYIYMM